MASGPLELHEAELEPTEVLEIETIHGPLAGADHEQTVIPNLADLCEVRENPMRAAEWRVRLP